MSPHYFLEVDAGKEVVVKLRLTNKAIGVEPFGKDFDTIFGDRIREADDFYRAIIPSTIGPQQMLISRQAYAGEEMFRYLLTPPPPPSRNQYVPYYKYVSNTLK